MKIIELRRAAKVASSTLAATKKFIEDKFNNK
jgi:hypothetical protein